MFDSVKGVIFDLDGTLVDSMWIWTKIDLDFIRTLGLEITPAQLMKDVAHFSFHETASYFRDQFNISQSVEEIKTLWIDAAQHEYAHNVFLKAGARDFLNELQARSIKMAIATSNTRQLLSTCLDANDIRQYFDALVTTDDTLAKSKSQPDVYLLAARSMGVSPADIVVFEDVPHAMAGARAAGMKVVAVRDAHTDLSDLEASQLADLCIVDFTDLLGKEPAKSIKN